MKEVKYHSRKFLNKKQGVAAIECDAELADYSCYASVTISDCSRRISLDFTSYDAKEFDDKHAKLVSIINELFELEQFLLEHKYDWTEALKKKALERKAKKKQQALSQFSIEE